MSIYFSTLSPNISINSFSINDQFDFVVLNHFLLNSFILRYSTFSNASSLTKHPFPFVTFLKHEFNDSIGFVEYINFLIF